MNMWMFDFYTQTISWLLICRSKDVKTVKATFGQSFLNVIHISEKRLNDLLSLLWTDDFMLSVSQAQGLCVPAGSAWRFPAALHPAWLFSLWAPGPRCQAWTWSWWEAATACRWSRKDLPQVTLVFLYWLKIGLHYHDTDIILCSVHLSSYVFKCASVDRSHHSRVCPIVY